MAPKARTDSTDPLKPKTEKAKVEKKSKVEKAEKPKAVKIKAGKADKGEKAEKSESKAKAEKKGEKSGEKEKVKTVTGDEAVSVMMEYLKSTNRPYSATEISANLHGKVTKTVADKLLKEMEQNQQITGKATNGDKKGSQWVFWALQDPADAASPTELADMETQISALRSNIPSLKSSLKIAATKLHTIQSSPTTSELSAMVEKLRAENKGKEEKLRGFKEGEVKEVSKEDMERVEKEWRYWSGKRTGRKRAFEELEDVILVSGTMTREELWERAGIEEEDA